MQAAFFVKAPRLRLRLLRAASGEGDPFVSFDPSRDPQDRPISRRTFSLELVEMVRANGREIIAQVCLPEIKGIECNSPIYTGLLDQVDREFG